MSGKGHRVARFDSYKHPLVACIVHSHHEAKDGTVCHDKYTMAEEVPLFMFKLSWQVSHS